MSLKFHRRELFQMALLAVAGTWYKKSFANKVIRTTSSVQLKDFISNNLVEDPKNFFSIFNNQELKSEFFYFLKNVYNLYPEKQFFDLIDKATKTSYSDQQTYQYLVKNIQDIKPFLSELTYAIPALAKQKQEMTDQTLKMLLDKKYVEGFLEIGSPGRYLGKLKEHVLIKGDMIIVNDIEPQYSVIDILERGQVAKLGRFVPLNLYGPISKKAVNSNSLDVVSNYIGFHHCELKKLDEFVDSLRRVLKPNGLLILREHDVVNPNMNHMVALAHDVFNAGLKVSWEINHNEVRNFRSIADWVIYLEGRGFKYTNQKLFQKGDPTKNALLKFVKA